MRTELKHESHLEPSHFISGSTYLYCIGLEQKVAILQSELEYAYTQLIVAGLKNVTVAVFTDSIKASMRNELCKITGRESQDLQEDFESRAFKQYRNEQL
jgi:hypothetical protein